MYTIPNSDMFLQDFPGNFAGLIGLGIVVVIGLICICALVLIPIYLIYSIGIQKLAQRKGIKDTWLAFIPIANLYLLGKIIDNADIGKTNVNRLEIVLPAVFACQLFSSSIFSVIPILGAVFSILFGLAIFIFSIFIYIKLFQMYKPDNYMPYAILSAIGFGFIMIFLVRNNDPVEVPPTGKPLF